ncbi:MAG: type II toxin-antitoxin system HicB family antitoxin [Devosia sp.]
MRYIAFVHKEPESIYGVSFPDFPGCIAAEDTLDKVLASAVDALASHVRLMEADGDPIPSPRSADEIAADPEFAEDRKGAMLAVVPLVRDLGSTTRINVSLDLGLLEAIDSAARQRGQTRSAFIASAVRKELTE